MINFCGNDVKTYKKKLVENPIESNKSVKKHGKKKSHASNRHMPELYPTNLSKLTRTEILKKSKSQDPRTVQLMKPPIYLEEIERICFPDKLLNEKNVLLQRRSEIKIADSGKNSPKDTI